MRPPRVSEDFVPISELKAQAAEWLRRIAETDAPIVITQHGRPAGVLLSPQAFDELTDHNRFMASVNAGMADALAGRVQSHASVKARFAKRARRSR